MKTTPGLPIPLGTSSFRDCVQFAVFSRNATSVSLLLFKTTAPDSSYDEIKLDPVKNKTGDIWHIRIYNIEEGQLYAYRIDGPYEPENGHRFNKNKVLIDPYAKALSNHFKWDLTKAQEHTSDSPTPDNAYSDIDSIKYVPKSILVLNRNMFSDSPLNNPVEEIIIYELHIRGFTIDDSSGVKEKGTYSGIIEKIPYLNDLGVNAVELLPIQEFDELENKNTNPLTGDPLINFWGYSTIAFFAPKGSYSSSGTSGEQINEFKKMVKAFHEAGIEVILDVVFNHTGERDVNGPTISFRGIDNSIYYILNDDKSVYKNYSGCGNTFNCNHPLVRDFILDCLKYWVIEMNIDGFRFDLASILGRDREGNILSNPPLIERIEEDPILRNTKIIAEAWDAAGAYQVGDFPGRWAEWNGRYRDDVKRFWRGDNNSIGPFATRLTGSSDLYQHSGKAPHHSINFITCHDGFTLNDLVCFNEKHNFANGENNRDGDNNNLSCNYGFEGNKAPKMVEIIRLRQIKNFIATLFLSHGTPMLQAGDEFRRTTEGNNNTYCQDNILSWINWKLAKKNEDILRFTKGMIRFRKSNPILRKNIFFTGEKSPGHKAPDIAWYNNTKEPSWSDDSHSLAALICGDYTENSKEKNNPDIFMIFNASKKNVNYTIPEAPSGNKWKIAIDTSLDTPKDIYDKGCEQNLNSNFYIVKKLSTVVLIT